MEHLKFLVDHGFNEQTNFTKAGILYVENVDFIITGPIGSDRMQVKAKSAKNPIKLNDLENLFLQMI